MERPRQEIPQGVRKRDSKLYSLTGWFTQPEGYGNQPFAFGGYFKYDTESKWLGNGQLADLWGESEIEGIMKDDLLSFIKLYSERGRLPVDYNFKRNDKGLWVGSWRGSDAGEGETGCAISLVDDDAFDIACGPITNNKPITARHWKKFLDKKVREGQINESELVFALKVGSHPELEAESYKPPTSTDDNIPF